MRDDAEQIAGELRSAYAVGSREAAEAFISHLNDKVEISHEPASPMDGIHESKLMRVAHLAEVEALINAIPDFKEVADVTTQGEHVIVDQIMTGTLSDGTALRARIVSTFTLTEGRITRIDAIHDPSEFAAVRRALGEGGLDIPETV